MGEAKEFGLVALAITGDEHVAQGLAELRVIEDFPEDVLECANHARLRESTLELFGPARVPWRHEVAEIRIERIADVDQQLSGQAGALAVQQIEKAVTDEYGGEDRLGRKRIRIAAGAKRGDL